MTAISVWQISQKVNIILRRRLPSFDGVAEVLRALLEVVDSAMFTHGTGNSENIVEK